MRLYSNTDYTTDTSDLLVTITRICYIDPAKKYIKVKLTLCNKHNGIVYEMNKNYKLWFDKIAHWKRA